MSEVAFSNGTAWDMWAHDWCYRPCQKDALFQRDLSPTGCPIILAVMLDNKVPPEWIQQGDRQDYHCIEFRPPGWRDPEPKPQPAPQPGPGLFPAPERSVRMLTAIPVPAEVSS